MEDTVSNFDQRSVSFRSQWKTVLSTGLLCSVMFGAAGAQAREVNNDSVADTMGAFPVAEVVPDSRISETELPQESPEELSSIESVGSELELSEEERVRFNLLVAADQMYRDERMVEATLLYKRAKVNDEQPETVASIPEPTFDIEGGAVKVYWREGNDGFSQGLESKIIVPLTLLTQKNPEFIPGHLKLAEGHNLFNRPEEALAALERGATIYPNVPELQEALMTQQASMMRWLPAAITARQFATLNPEHERAAEFLELSEAYQKKFRATLRENITSNAIGSVLTGALSVGTGNIFGAISPIQNALALLRGENSVGRSAVKSYRKKLPMLEDEAVNAYVNRIGQKLSAVSGREMEYEFFVVNDERLNAFALPGGKVFIHSGAILKSRSEAELAGLMAHELSHTVLSHGFQMYTKANATGSFTQLIPFSGVFSRVAVTKYSRDLEKQADLLGTRILANSGYAADGLENLSRTLLEEDEQTRKGSLFATHPDTEKRIQYIGELIERNGYNRYAYEGVSEHSEIQKLVRIALDELKEEESDQDVSPQKTAKQPLSNP